MSNSVALGAHRIDGNGTIWRGLRAAALLLPVLYVLAVLGGWLATAHTGDDGVTCAVTGVTQPSDCRIVEVAAGSSAERAGLRPGDEVIATDGIIFVTPDGIPRWFYHPAAGEPVVLTVRRGAPSGAPSGGPVEDVSIVLRSRLEVPGVGVSIVLYALGGLLASTVGIIVVRARPREPAARQLFLSAVASNAFLTIEAWQYAGPRDPPLNAWFWWAFFVGVLAYFVIMLHLFLAFPTVGSVLMRLRALGPAWLRRVGGGTFVLYVPILAAFETPPERAPVLQNLLVLVLVALVVVTLIIRYRRASTSLARAQLKWALGRFRCCPLAWSQVRFGVIPTVTRSSPILPMLSYDSPEAGNLEEAAVRDEGRSSNPRRRRAAGAAARPWRCTCGKIVRIRSLLTAEVGEDGSA